MSAARRQVPAPTPSGPPPSKPPRSVLRVRDMLGAVGALLLIVLVTGGVRSCQFAPLGPQVDPGVGPSIDAPARLADFAHGSAFPLRVPTLPQGWRTSSVDRSPVDGGGTAVRIGYVTAGGRYLRLVESDATEENLVLSEARVPLPARGTIDGGGRAWVEYRASDGAEPFRVTTSPDTPQARLLITGSGTDDEFRTLAGATLTGSVLPAGTPS